MAREVYQNGTQYEDLVTLEAAIRRAWDNVSEDVIADLITSMNNRIYNVIRSNGRHSGY